MLGYKTRDDNRLVLQTLPEVLWAQKLADWNMCRLPAKIASPHWQMSLLLASPQHHFLQDWVSLASLLLSSEYNFEYRAAVSGTLLWLFHSAVLVRLYIITESQSDESEPMKMFFCCLWSFFLSYSPLFFLIILSLKASLPPFLYTLLLLWGLDEV